MARRTAAEAPPPDDGNTTDDDVQETLEQLQELATGPDFEVYLFRIEPRARWQRGDAFLERFRSTCPTLEEIQETYGGGVFRLRPRKNGAWFGKSVVQTIEGEPIMVTRRGPRGAGTSIVTPPASELEERIARLEERASGGSGDDEPAAARERREERREFRQMMREYLLAKAFADDGGKRGADPIEQLERLLELRERLESRDDPEPEETPDVLTSINRLVASAGAAPAPRIAGEHNPGSVPARRAPAPPEERLLDFVKYLARAAEKDQDPDELVSWTLQMIPRPLRERIPTLDAGTWLRVFMPYAETFQVLGMPHGQAWLEKLRARLTSRILELAKDPTS